MALFQVDNSSKLFTIETIEVRWFFEGKAPIYLMDFFKESLVDVRQDGYWLEPIGKFANVKGKSEDNIFLAGIKWREGRLEIKSRKNIEAHDKNIPGIIERWEKTGYPEVKEKSRKIIEVDKKRRQRRYVYHKGKIVNTSNVFIQGNGCAAELTQLNVYDETFWTFSFEAFGDIEKQTRILKDTFFFFLSELGEKDFPGKLTVANSLSYPEWLCRFIK